MTLKKFKQIHEIDKEFSFDGKPQFLVGHKKWGFLVSIRDDINKAVILFNMDTGAIATWPETPDDSLKQRIDAEINKFGFDSSRVGTWKYPTKDFGFFDDNNPDYNGLAEYFKNEFHYKHSDELSYIYEDEHYKYAQHAKIMSLIDDLTMRKAKPHHLGAFKKKIDAHCYFPKENMQSPPGLINLKNCVLNIGKREMIKHSPNYFFTNKLAHNYDRDAKCPEFMKFLNFIFSGDQELIDLIGEIIGYTIMGGDPKAHRAFAFFGEGRNGKSTLLDVIAGLLGDDAVAKVSMRNLDKPFSMVLLDGKLANIVEESPHKIDPEAFKNIVGGGEVVAAHKGKPEFFLKVNARLFFACNKLPRFNESSNAIKDRLIFVPFNNYIPEKDRDKGIKERLAKEMPGILNFALDGLDRYLARGFTQSKASRNLLEEYLDESDSVNAWFKECIEITLDMNDRVGTMDSYQNYKSFCAVQDRKNVNYNSFSKRFKKLIDDYFLSKNMPHENCQDLKVRYPQRGYMGMRMFDASL